MDNLGAGQKKKSQLLHIFEGTRIFKKKKDCLSCSDKKRSSIIAL